MSGVAPIGPMQEYSPNHREEEIDRMEKPSSTQPPTTETSPQVIKSDARKKAENATLYGFRYTGTGSFIDKVF
ncbi:MAG: hypothetical protein H0S80_05490 [Desulfovibrionaceae bacterium]|nr:hypothetical protein [Desulfovibrionaceae bacterium]